MKLKKLKTYQSIEFIKGGGGEGLGKIKSLNSTFDTSNVRELPGLDIEILPNLGVVRIKTETDCKLVSLGNVEYAVELDAQNVEPKSKKVSKSASA